MDYKLMHALSKEQEDLVLAEIGYTREQLKADLSHMREWLKKQHHLPATRLKERDAFLEWYLTGCKGSLETVKRKLDNYYTIRGYSEIFENRDPLLPEYVAVRNMFTGAIIPQLGHEGERLGIVRISEFIAEKFDHVIMNRVLINPGEIFMRSYGFSSRHYFMFDCRGATPALALKIKLSALRDFVFFTEEVMAIRFIKFSFIYTPSYIETIVNSVMKPFMSKKLKERLYVTSGGPEDLLNYFSPSVLPSDYGGDSSNPTLQDYNDLWMQKDRANRDWLLNELSERTDESKRIVTDKMPKNPYFGVHGSLKQLVID